MKFNAPLSLNLSHIILISVLVIIPGVKGAEMTKSIDQEWYIFFAFVTLFGFLGVVLHSYLAIKKFRAR